ncbi:hypothetical protein FRC12_008729 [Ceratobasidium sp. 428]|nr:hypothetical protein FRC12_008729 [Ceratobasidium sp. 428]
MPMCEVASWGSTSTPAQWIQKGREYFANKMYDLAAQCFEQAGSKANTSYRIAKAYDNMSRAKSARNERDTEGNRRELRKVAAELGDCATAARGESARYLWFHRAECLELVHATSESAEAFANAEQYERAIRILLDSKFFKQGAKFLLKYGHNLEAWIRTEFLDRCRRQFFEDRNYSELPPLFDSNPDHELIFARKHSFREQLKHRLEHYERFDELAQICLEDKSLNEGLDWLLKAFDHHARANSLDEAARVVDHHSAWILSLEGQRYRPAVEKLEAMIGRILRYGPKLDPKYTKALETFQSIANRSVTPDAAGDWDQEDFEERPMKVLVLHNVLRDMSRLLNRNTL